MYFKFRVKIPEIAGKIVIQKKSGSLYVDYVYERAYDKSKGYTVAKRSTIGKICNDDEAMMIPNQNYFRFFPDAEIPEESEKTERSSCIKSGAYIVIKKIIQDYKLEEYLGKFFSEKDIGLFLDLAAYSIISENNAGQYYPNYAYNHALFTQKMKVYSDSKVSDFLSSVTDDQSIGFLNAWNEKRDHREKIYISYDSTNKNCQAGDIEMVEYGHAKDPKGLPIFNYAIAYDTCNSEPLFYEKYPGSINDVAQLQFMLDKACGYGYKKIGFILDRGYFSKINITTMDRCGYDFVIMAKGMSELVSSLIMNNRNTFEEEWKNYIPEYDVQGITVKSRLYADDKKDRYFHLYYKDSKNTTESRLLRHKIIQMRNYLELHANEKRVFGPNFEKYFSLHYKDDVFLMAEPKNEVITREIRLCGYFVIITSKAMTAAEAIGLYKSRDASEKLFRGDKSYLGNKSLRVYDDDSASAKIFLEFIALIIRNRIYSCLKAENQKLTSKQNYMTVPAAIMELEKIELTRQSDNIYRLDHAVSATQKTILNAFGMDADDIRSESVVISKMLEQKQ